jgi:hypothetical protein
MHIHPDIFGTSHKRVFLSGGVELNTQKLLQKGRPLYCVGKPDIETKFPILSGMVLIRQNVENSRAISHTEYLDII